MTTDPPRDHGMPDRLDDGLNDVPGLRELGDFARSIGHALTADNAAESADADAEQDAEDVWWCRPDEDGLDR